MFYIHCVLVDIVDLHFVVDELKDSVGERAKRPVAFFMGVLHGCSKTWKLAERSYNLVKEKIQQVSVKDERQENNNNDNISSSNNNNNSNNKTIDAPTPLSSVGSTSDTQQQQNMMFDDNIDFLGGPPVLMTADLFNEDWEALFPDYVFNSKVKVN